MTKILLVEDDRSLQEIYSVRLEHEGYQVVTASDGEEALNVAIKEKPDLILSDVMMPKISGFDMLDILRTTPEIKDTKVIIMTALSSEDQRERGEALGADRYLVKSQVGIEDIIQAVDQVLNHSPSNTSTETTTTELAPAQDNSFIQPLSKPAAPPIAYQSVIDQPTVQIMNEQPLPTPEPALSQPHSTQPLPTTSPNIDQPAPITEAPTYTPTPNADQTSPSLHITADDVPQRASFSIRDIIPEREK